MSRRIQRNGPDCQIVRKMVKQRFFNQTIADQLGLSVSAVLYRKRKLHLTRDSQYCKGATTEAQKFLARMKALREEWNRLKAYDARIRKRYGRRPALPR
jgi:predicted transcriptional regulator